MGDTVWPTQADKRLLSILQKQVQGSLELLQKSTEGGLMHLSEALDSGDSAEAQEKIMLALTELQNIDRVMQRLTNVETTLGDWAAATNAPAGAAMWEDAVSKRYVMEEERQVMRGEL